MNPRLLDGDLPVPFADGLRKAVETAVESLIGRAARGESLNVSANWMPAPAGGELRITIGAVTP